MTTKLLCTLIPPSQTNGLWGQWKVTQDTERRTSSAEEAWVESNRVRTHENGKSLHPDWISRRFNRLVELSGLPPIRLHDTRHLSATLALLGKADIKVVQERLGHNSRQITSDTYTSVLPQLMTAEAESTIAVVPQSPKNGPEKDEPSPAEDPNEISETDPGTESSVPDEGLRPAA